MIRTFWPLLSGGHRAFPSQNSSCYISFTKNLGNIQIWPMKCKYLVRRSNPLGRLWPENTGGRPKEMPRAVQMYRICCSRRIDMSHRPQITTIASQPSSSRSYRPPSLHRQVVSIDIEINSHHDPSHNRGECTLSCCR